MNMNDLTCYESKIVDGVMSLRMGNNPLVNFVKLDRGEDGDLRIEAERTFRTTDGSIGSLENFFGYYAPAGSSYEGIKNPVVSDLFDEKSGDIGLVFEDGTSVLFYGD